jgi:Short C-terminal domain
MPIGRRRRPIERAAVIGTVAYQGSKRGAQAGAAGAEGEAEAPAAEAPAPVVAPEDDPTTEKINELAQLHASGAITDEEFAAAKAKALGIG